MTNKRMDLDLPRLPHDAAKGEIAFVAMLARKGHKGLHDFPIVEVPLYGYRDQPTFARADFSAGRRPKVTRVVGPLARKVR